MSPYEPNRPSRRPSLNRLSPRWMRGESLPLATLGIGTVLGLILGLIIGWGLFPVQWTNAWPGDLSDEARAQYLAAVAEAYVYYGDEQAAEIARNRLYDLNDNLADEIAAAQRYFAENPSRNAPIYINNLGQLAQGLEIQSPDIIVEDAGAEAPEGAPAQAPADTGSNVRTWLNWLLWVIAAVALVIGGLIVIARLSQQRTAQTHTDFVDDEPEGFDDEDDFDARPGRDLFRRPAPSPVPTSVRETDRDRSPSRYEAPPAEDYGFEEEQDDSSTAFTSGTPIASLEGDPETLYEDYQDYDEYDAYDESQVALEDEDLDPMEAAPTTRVRPEDSPGQFDEEELDTTSYAPAHRQDGVPLKTFTVHYQAGIPDYDQAYSIMDPNSGRYIGECGMGVNLKNGVLQNSPDSVIALDVWLVDKLQERSYASQSRVLLSEYVVDNGMEAAFTRERPDDAAPLVPQPGMTFQLTGPNLVLDCEVREASYVQNGPTAGIFQSVQIDMTVRVLA